MILPVRIETLLWLLPIVFMFHDFEEIILFMPWIQRNRAALLSRFPKLAARFLPQFAHLSTSSFALAVAEEFVLLSVLTAVSVELKLYAVWAGLLLGFFIHLILHLVQFAVFGRYVPVIFTSGISALYCLAALHDLNIYQPLDWTAVAGWTLLALLLLGINLLLAHALARKFEGWLRKTYPQQ